MLREKVFFLSGVIALFLGNGVVFGQSKQELAEDIQAVSREIFELYDTSPGKAIALGRQYYDLAVESEVDSLIYQTSQWLDEFYWIQGMYDSSNYFIRAYTEQAQAMGLDEVVAKGYNNLGLTFQYLGNNTAAIEYLETALDMREKLGDEAGVASTLNNIGIAYMGGVVTDYDIAKGYIQRAVKIKLEQNLRDKLASSYINLWNIYVDERKFDSAGFMLDKALAIAGEVNNKGDYIATLASYGQHYIWLNDYDQAFNYLTQAKQMAIEEELTNEIPEVDQMLALLYSKQGKNEQALKLAKSFLKERPYRIQGYELISSIYADLGQFDSAYYFRQKSYIMLDSLSNSNLQNALVGMEMSAQATESRRRLEEKNQQLKAQNDLNLFLIIILCLVMLLVLVVFNRYNIKRKNTEELERRNREILDQKEEIETQKSILIEKNSQLEHAQHIIREQNDELTNINAKLEQKVRDRTVDLKDANDRLTIAIQDLDRFIYKTSHDIRGPLARLMGLCSLALLDVKDDQSLQYFNMLDITAKSLNRVLLRLITINEINNSKIKPEEISFEKVKEEVIQSMQRLDGYKDVTFDWNLPDATYESDYNIMLLIVNNLVENGVKYRNTSPRVESFVKVDLAYTEDALVIEVCDNGIGIDHEERTKLHLMFTKSVENYEITGLGLYLVKLSVDKLKGSIAMINHEEGYTCLRVTLPLEFKETRLPAV